MASWPDFLDSICPAFLSTSCSGGNNRLPCFLDDADRQRYLHLLRDALLHTGSLLHAYVLMDNHVHLLLTPPDTGVTAQLMQKLGRQYVGQFKAKPQSRSLSGGN
ncbi:TPA: transposase [Burkholderia cepacia]